MYDFHHLTDKVVVIFPLLQQRCFYVFFIFCVYNIDNHLLLLQKAIYSVYGLDEVVELIINTQEYSTVTMFLKIASGSGH